MKQQESAIKKIENEAVEYSRYRTAIELLVRIREEERQLSRQLLDDCPKGESPSEEDQQEAQRIEDSLECVLDLLEENAGRSVATIALLSKGLE